MGPGATQAPPGQEAVVFSAEDGYIGLDTYDVLRQRVVSHHFRFAVGKHARVFHTPHRYIWVCPTGGRCRHDWGERRAGHGAALPAGTGST